MKTILTGIDFTAPSPAVLRHAIHVARPSGNPVHAVHVLDSGRIARWASGGERTSADALSEQAQHRLDAFVSEHAPDAGVATEIRVGRTATELCHAVEEHDADLLVIAANDLTKKRLGSVASACVRCAACDVMVLRDWQEGDFEKIVVCTDFSAMSARAMERGARLAAANGARLEIVHVLYPPDHDLWGVAVEIGEEPEEGYATRCRERARREGEDFLASHTAALEKVDHQLVILESEVPSVAINSYLEDSGADLAVLGTRGHSRIGGMFLGTNAERLLHDVAVSVVAVRPDEASH
ncbi:universal stress protein [Haloferula sp.]|uniref:universal stress protein n=1 Tax=Haloferula sp. TaxID=2497595 RepID=UPI003C75F7EE